MERGKFLEEIGTLEAFFEKQLSIEQVKDWYEELKDYPIERLRIAIRTAKTTCKFLPKLAEFLSFIKDARIEVQERERIPCNKCNGTGYLIYTKKVLNGNKILEYDFAGICECGNETKYDGTQVRDKQNKSKYYTNTVQELENYKEIWDEKNGRKVFIKLEQNVWG